MDRYIPGPHSREVTIRQDAAPIYYLQPVAEHRRVVQVGPRHDAGKALYGYQAQQIQLELDVQMIGPRVHEPFLLQLGKGVGDPDTLALVAQQGQLDFALQHGHVRLFQRLIDLRQCRLPNIPLVQREAHISTSWTVTFISVAAY